MRIGVVGAIVTALCCFTPALVITLGLIGLSAYAGYLDYVLFPTLAVFVGLIIYALHRQNQVEACCDPDEPDISGDKND